MIHSSIVYRSLLPNSRVLWFAMGLVLFAAVVGTYAGIHWYGAMLASTIGLSLGISITRYKQSELANQVPGLLRAQTQAVFHFTMALLLFLALVVLIGEAGSQWLLFSTGLTLLMVAGGLCLGAGDVILFYWGCLVSLLVTAIGLSSVNRFGESAAFLVNERSEMFGLVFLGLGVALCFRFWKLINREDDFVTTQMRWQARQPNSASGIKQIDVARMSSLSRVGRLVEVAPTYRKRDCFWFVLYVGFIVGLLLYTRGKDGAVVFFQLIICLILIALPAAFFFGRIKESFQRIWILGANVDRRSTVRHKLLLATHRSLFGFVYAAIALAIHSASSLSHYVSSLCILLLAFGISALVLFLGSRLYRFWAEHSKVAVVVSAVFVLTLTVGVFSITEGKQDIAAAWVSRFGILNSFLVAFGFSASCWAICLWDGGRGVASDSALMD